MCLCIQGESEICPTPNAPRGQTKAPRLDIYRPAPHVVVDTGRPVKNKESQTNTSHPRDDRDIHDKLRPQDHGRMVTQTHSNTSQPQEHRDVGGNLRLQEHGAVVAQTQSSTLQPQDHRNVEGNFRPQDHGRVVDQAPSNTSHLQGHRDIQGRLRPRGHGTLVAQAQSNTSQPQDHRDVEGNLRLQDHGRMVNRTHSNSSQLQDQWRLQSATDQLQTRPSRTPTRPSRTHNTQSKITRTEDLQPTRRPTKPPASPHQRGLDSERNKPASDGDKENKSLSAPQHTATSATSESHGSVADDDYAVKYRLGLVPRRSNEPKRRSEYQREFQWRTLQRNSPLISANEVHTFTNLLIELLT